MAFGKVFVPKSLFNKVAANASNSQQLQIKLVDVGNTRRNHTKACFVRFANTPEKICSMHTREIGIINFVVVINVANIVI